MSTSMKTLTIGDNTYIITDEEARNLIQQLNSQLSSTKTEIDTELDNKQNIIADLDTIRSNASIGANLSSSVSNNSTNITNLQSSIDILNGDNTIEGSVDNKIAIALENVGYTYSTNDLEPGVSSLDTGKLYIVYE